MSENKSTLLEMIAEEERILARFGVSRVEYEAMICPHYGICGEPAEIVGSTMCENNWPDKPDEARFSGDEYLAAIEGMIAKGWLCLQEKKKRAKRERRPDDDLPQPEPYNIPAGSVVFTKKGYLLHRRLQCAVNGLRSARELDSFSKIDRRNREIHLYTAIKSHCQEWLHEMQQVCWNLNRLATYVDPPVEVVSVHGPTPIGKWKPSQYHTLSKGYHAVVRYRQHRRKPFNVEEIRLEAEFMSFEPVLVFGKLDGQSIWFGDNPYWTCGPNDVTDDSCAQWQWDFRVNGFSQAETPANSTLGDESPSDADPWKPLFQLDEGYHEPRKKTLTVEQSKSIILDCVKKYTQHGKGKITNA